MKHNALQRRGHVALAVLLVFFSHPALAATIIVDETSCTLVDAITSANTDTAVGGCAAGSGADTIELTTDVTLTEVNNGSIGNATGLPEVQTEITLLGGRHVIERGGGPHFRILRIEASGVVQLHEVTISNGVADFGAGIFNNGDLTMTDCTVSGNDATLNESTFSDIGGGIASSGGATLDRVTISGNAALFSGGGIYSADQMTISNSTISDNSSFDGGGIFNGAGAVTITNTTVIGNQEGLGGSLMQVANSILAANGVNCADSFVFDGEGNFADDSTCGAGFDAITPGVDIEVTLADNGGPTQTHALLPGSVAIDAVGDCVLETDQRGFPRDDGACDSGSFEQQMCGDGVLDPGEECDDGSNADGDGCAADCTVEERVPASSPLALLVLLAILMTVSWARLRLKWGARHPT